MKRRSGFASATGATLQSMPHAGTRLRAVYDRLMEQRGYPVDLGGGAINQGIIAQLRDFYGLDIRTVRKESKGKGGHPGVLHILAGEWSGAAYLDYIADRIK